MSGPDPLGARSTAAHPQAALRIRVPWRRGKAEVGLGDVMRNVTSALRIPECASCARRAEALNRLVVFDAEQGQSNPANDPIELGVPRATVDDWPAPDRPAMGPAPAAEVRQVDRLYKTVARSHRRGLIEFGHAGLIGQVGWLDVLLGELATGVEVDRRDAVGFRS